MSPLLCLRMPYSRNCVTDAVHTHSKTLSCDCPPPFGDACAQLGANASACRWQKNRTAARRRQACPPRSAGATHHTTAAVTRFITGTSHGGSCHERRDGDATRRRAACRHPAAGTDGRWLSTYIVLSNSNVLNTTYIAGLTKDCRVSLRWHVCCRCLISKLRPVLESSAQTTRGMYFEFFRKISK